MDVKVEPIEAVCISDDELCQNRRKIIRGPNKKSSGAYAGRCEFGNNVALDHQQEAFLKAYCAQKKPSKPFYVCALQESHVIKGKCKTYFTKSYSKTHLRSHLQKKDLKVEVIHHKTEKTAVKMKLMSRKGDRRAMMITEWMSVVNQWGGKFKKGHILLFWFRRNEESDAGFRVIVKKLQPCVGAC